MKEKQGALVNKRAGGVGVIKRFLLFLWLISILVACSGMAVETENDDSYSYSRFVTEENAQKAVDFEVKFPQASPLVNEPLIEINKPPIGYVEGEENIRFWTSIDLYYYAKSGLIDEEIRVIQSLNQVRNLYMEKFDSIKIKGKDVCLSHIDKQVVYFWKDGNTNIEVWIYGQQLHDDAMQIIEELLK